MSQKEKEKFLRIPWKEFKKDFLEKIKDEPWEKIKSSILEETKKILNVTSGTIQFSKTTFFHALEDNNLSRSRISTKSNQWTRLTKEEQEAFCKIYTNGTSDEIKEAIKKTYPNADSLLIYNLSKFAGLSGQRKLKGAASINGKKKEKSKINKSYALELLTMLANEPCDLSISLIAERLKINIEETKEYLEFLRPQLEKKGYDFFLDKVKNEISVSRKSFELLKPETFEIQISPDEYNKGGANVGAFSGFYYGSDELFREGLLELNQFVQKQNRAHFLILCSGLVNGTYLENQLQNQLKGVRKRNEKRGSCFLLHELQENCRFIFLN